jgi:stage II sporulation protein D
MRTLRVDSSISGTWIKRSCLIILVLLTLLSAACGKKAKAKLPMPPAPSKRALPQAKSETKTVLPPAIIVEPKKPVVESTPPDAGIRSGPPIRIGLTANAKEIRFSSPGDFYVLEKKPESERQLLEGEIQVRVEQESNEASLVYRIQVASFKKAQMAEELQKELTESLGVPVRVYENSEVGTTQVRVGEFATRDEAQSFLEKTIRRKHKDAFIVKESVSAESGKIMLALRGKRSFFLTQTGFLVMPASSAGFLSFDGNPYRGIFDISLNQSGRITVVNQLGTEEYLLGVVPAELSPERYPEFNALAAQAIAARTYALKHMGSFRSEGYDLTADTRMQVYKGVAFEKDATNLAVQQTYGMAIYYQNQVIDAMYMSTCGGRTEDYSNVFEGPPVPYLKSVFCSVESNENDETILQASHALEQAVLADDGSLANRNLEFAGILGMIESGSELSPEILAAPASQQECASWIENARKIIRKNKSGEPPVPRGDLTTRAGFLQFAAESFFGADEIKRKISAQDAVYYLSNLADGDSVPEKARYALAYLMQNGLWRPFPDNTIQSKNPIRRGDAISLLLSWIESTQPDILRKGVFVSAGESSAPAITVKWGSRTQQFPLSKKLIIFRLDANRTTPVNSLRIIGNEKLRFHVDQHGSIDFLEVELNPTGASSDRYSPVATWDVTMTRTAIADKLRPLTGNIGEFRDLKPSRIGNSGRAVQIEIAGSRGSVLVNGNKMRSALGLKDTLFTIAREFNPDGSIAGFAFHGRGNGHGVGLCQVGAYGMAKAGRSYEEILKTYYSGVEIRKAY